MEKYFRNASKFYKGYFELKGKLAQEYLEAQASGDFSNSYMKNMSNKHQGQLLDERKAITSRMTALKEEFARDLTERYNFEKHTISDRLQKLLNSGIKLNDRELLQIAESHKDNLTESRLLHDHAESLGYKLSNYIPYEIVMQNFDNYCRHISDSLSAVDTLAMPYITLEDCEMSGGKLCKDSMIPKMEIEPIPQTVEEEIARDVIKQNQVTKEAMEAFLIGLNGTEEERELFKQKLEANSKEMSDEEKLKLKIAMLTDEEKADAKHMSLIFGNNGEITQKEIEYIESSEYAEVKETANDTE